MAKKVLLDTDIGSDIDDAVCLAYLLAQPECDLLGITTVTGETKKRAMLASALCKVAGVEIPIHRGSDDPILVVQRQKKAPQAAKLDKWEHDTDFDPGTALEFLRTTIRQNPGEVTLLAIGPMTNVGLLFAADPEIPSLLNELVLMCGAFRTGGPGRTEWNAGGDPHATVIVYRAEATVHRSLGLDVTARVQMSAEDVRRRFSTKLLKPVADFAEVWFDRREVITFHDPLAAATLFDPEVCAYERGRVEVELNGDRSKGMTYWKSDSEGTHEIGVDVDPDRFFDHYFSVFE